MSIEIGKINIEPEPQGVVVDRLCAAVKMPGGFRASHTLFFGWTADGRPTTVSTSTQLSKQAQESYTLTKSVEFPFSREYAQYSIIPVEFVSAGKPIDRQDPKAEDIIVYGIKDYDNKNTVLRVTEVSTLESILRGHVVWEDVNARTVFAQETIPAQEMHMTFIPTRSENDEPLLYAFMFAPVVENESNELTYRQFLVQTIKSLISLDQQQKSGFKRGYEQAASALIEKDLTGSDAYVVMYTLKRLGIVDMDERELDKLRIQSSGKDFKYQLMLLAKQAGLVEMTEEYSDAKTHVEQFSIEELTKILDLSYRLARKSIG